MKFDKSVAVRVENDEESKIVQDMCFENGINWQYSPKNTYIQYALYPKYLYVDIETGFLTHTSSTPAESRQELILAGISEQDVEKLSFKGETITFAEFVA
jgi:hypothetical protein